MDAQIRALAKRAANLGILSDYIGALERIDHHLHVRPLGWGDPEYNLKHDGGVVLHGIEDPLFLRFAVYQIEYVVCVIELVPLPNSPFAADQGE